MTVCRCQHTLKFLQILANLNCRYASVCREWEISLQFCPCFVIKLGWLTGFVPLADNTGYIASEIVLLATFSFPCLARGSFEMRNYITSSIANVIRRYRAAAMDMSRMDIGSTSNLWHAQLCTAVQPAGDSYQRSHGRLLTSVVQASGSGIGNLLSQAVGRFLKPVNERNFVETTGSNCQQRPSTGISGTRVS